ncbi:MAG: hypothetical protein AAF722_14970 [Cyanobacteria bacterium P01_C01_bin.70]
MPTVNNWIPQIFSPRIFWRIFTGMTALLSLTACTFDLDDPTGAKQRRAKERRVECQQIDSSITTAHYEQAMAAYKQGLAANGTQTQAGLLAEAEVSLRTTDVLEALELEDENLQSMSLNIAAGLRQMAEAKRDMAPFADIEATITSANDRSAAHQASVVQRNDASRYYAGTLRAIESYCEGDAPSSVENLARQYTLVFADPSKSPG